jgi:hypothetical protein
MRKTLLCSFLACTALLADDDHFRENFADPATRSAALAELVPGTRSAYFHTALDHQLAGREAEFKKVLSEWKAASERKDNPLSTEGLAVLENRQLLMSYGKNPVNSLAELIRRLDLEFDDTRPDAAAAAESLPTRLDPELIFEAAFEKAVLEKSPETPYQEYSGERLLRDLDQVEKFDDAKVRWFVEKLDRADLPGVVPLVDRALGLDRTVSFTGHSLFGKLTSNQLEKLLELHPDLRAKESFAVAYLSKLLPGAETDFDRDPKAHAEHLRRCRDFIVTLPPSQNSLKAHVLFHHLRLQAELGNHPKADFLAFLGLPRSRHNLLRFPETADPASIRLGADFAEATRCEPVRDDLLLIQSFLQHFLGGTDSAAEFAPYVPEKSLVRLHARARLLAGADPVRWGKAIDPAEFKSLQEEARIGFAPGAPGLLDADAAVSLALDLKKTPDLLIRIYELDLPAQLASHGTEPQVDVDLDGLVPHHERHIAYSQAPLLQHRETIALPELAGPGAWLVDFVSGQVSARALIRKGQLIAFPERTATGQTVRVFDEKGNAVPAASVQLRRENFTADASGRIVIPDAPNNPVTRGIVRTGKLATPITLATRSDELALDAAFHLDREQLLADQEAKLQLRVRLTNHGHELPLDRIKDPALVLKAELLGGVTTERVVAENLKLTPTMEIPFQVPANLLKLTLTLRGTVTPATGGDPLKLSKESVYQINADLKEARVGTAFFSPTTEGSRLEFRGRNGEPLPSRAITLVCKRRGYDASIKVQVRTDSQGRVDLGNPGEDVWFSATGVDIAEAGYCASSRFTTYTGNLQFPVGAEIHLPLEKSSAAPDHLKLSLLETLDGKPVRDQFDKIAVADGQIVIRGLPPGDFRLVQGRLTTKIQISSGVEKDNLLVSKTRILPRLTPVYPTIASASAENDELKIQLRNHGPETRISLIAKRYDLDWHAGEGIYPFAPPLPDNLTTGFLSCDFLTDRKLSDEMRYILDRRAAKTFAGSLLPRPGLLLHRWTEEDLKQGSRSSHDGQGGNRSDTSKGFSSGSGLGKPFGRESGRSSPSPTVCDFLQFPAAVRFDLKPEADGSLKLPLADFEGSQFIEIVATDFHSDDKLLLPLPPNETPLRDRRIARPLDPQAHHLANRSAAVLQKGAQASIENLLDADWRAFTTLTEAHQFLYGMTGDDRLREFVFLTEWPTFSDAKKLELLSQHACHEFHLFLARKDPEFFGKFVKPLLAGKPEPQFLDDYLLGRDLSAYLRPYAWQRLNAAEKALLSQALPAARERISRELKLRWDLEAPEPDAETTLFTQTLRGSDLALQDSLGLARENLRRYGPTPGKEFVTEKLRRIVIPRIDFEDITINEAIQFLREQTVEHDTTELDSKKKGIRFVVRDPAGELARLRVRELRIRNVPVAVALKYMCDSTKLRYKVDDSGVTVSFQTEAGDESFTRTFQVPPDFALIMDAGGNSGGGPLADPFAGPQESQTLTPRKSILELLKAAGINFPEGSTATLSRNGTLVVTNTRSELDKVEALTQVTGASKLTPGTRPPAYGFSNTGSYRADFSLPAGDLGLLPPIDLPELPNSMGGTAADPFAAIPGHTGKDFISPVEGTSVDGIPAKSSNGVTNGLRSGDQAVNRNSIDAILNNPDGAADPFAAPSAGSAQLTARQPRLTFPDRTKLWREANYYKNTAPTGESLIPLNRFWLDLAAWDGKGPFLSPHFNACHTNANESLMALALLDLAFKAERPEVTVDGSTLRVKAREPMLLFYKDTRRTENVAPESPLLVRQTFSPLDEPFRTENGREVENPVTGDFRPGVAYSASLIVTNPTGIGRRIDLLAQIPAGAIPLKGKPATQSSTHELKPYGVVMEQLAFYFPAAGDFAVYPLHVSENGTVLAHTDVRTLRVSSDPAPQDAASWQVLASEGSDDEVLGRLATENLETIDLADIRWRLKDPAFFLKASKLLRERLHFSADVASFGFLHNDVAAIRDFLENSEVVRQVGAWLGSPLLDVRPRVHLGWETLEFDPLVNPRVHRFGEESRMTHETARAHYQAFLDQLGWKPALEASDELNLTAFLFLQDRIEEGLARFDRIDPAKLPGRLNYDYLKAVALFHREQAAEAKTIATATLPTLPPGLWRDRFQAVIDQADEIAALDQPGEAEKPDPEIPAPQLDLALSDTGKLVIKHRSLEKATLRLFSVDLEVLFSKNPFLQGDNGTDAQPAIRPNESFAITLANDSAGSVVELPTALRKGNILVSADSGSKKLLKVLDSRAIDLRHTPGSRIVQVRDAATSKPLAKTYVKVYAQTQSGEVVFHKDGYTDLRGKFDYLSHTGIDPATIKRVAILVSHPEKGARTVVYER